MEETETERRQEAEVAGSKNETTKNEKRANEDDVAPTENAENGKKSQAMLAIGLVTGLVILICGLMVLGPMLASWNMAATVNSTNNGSAEQEGANENANVENDEGDESDDAELIYIGDDKLGYIATNGTWKKSGEVADGSIYVNGLYTLMIGTETGIIGSDENDDQMKAAEYAAERFEELSEDEEVTELKDVKKVALNEYKAYLVSYYHADENIWSKTWWFEAEDELVHYIVIEGPDAKSNKFNLAETYTLKIGESE